MKKYWQTLIVSNTIWGMLFVDIPMIAMLVLAIEHKDWVYLGAFGFFFCIELIFAIGNYKDMKKNG